jgi:hypothetical membrane protein
MVLTNLRAAGTLLFAGGAQFIVALIMAEAIYPDYSVSKNYISDLGVWGKSSALIFNPSIMIFGLCILAGAYFLFKQWGKRGFCVLVAVSGAGPLGVGLFPENTFLVAGIPVLHSISALFAFVGGGLVAIAAYRYTKAPFRYLSIVMGAVALVAFGIFLATRDFGALGIGAGGLERLTAYPSLLWNVGFGGYLLAVEAKNHV